MKKAIVFLVILLAAIVAVLTFKIMQRPMPESTEKEIEQGEEYKPEDAKQDIIVNPPEKKEEKSSDEATEKEPATDEKTEEKEESEREDSNRSVGQENDASEQAKQEPAKEEGRPDSNPKDGISQKDNPPDEERAARIREQVKPSIVYATMKTDAGGFKKGEKVEIVRDKGNGARYYVRSGNKEGWVKGGTLSIPKDFATLKDRMSKEDMEYFVNVMNDFDSKTKYFIWIDLARQLVNVFEGEKGNWKLIHSFVCGTGRNPTPTIRGTFEVLERGRQFGNKTVAKNWVRFYDSYLMHSILYNSSGKKVVDGTLGKRVSHGCVRLSYDDSKWIYNNIPNGTTVWVN